MYEQSLAPITQLLAPALIGSLGYERQEKHDIQSHKNPCSIAALLRGNFWSLVHLAEMLTKIYAVGLLKNFHSNGFVEEFKKKCFLKKYP